MVFVRKTPNIAGSADSIASLEAIPLGGVEQWLLLRGEDISKPVLLWVHGGPGGAQIGFVRGYIAELEKNFVVVNWDQRGAGLSYSSTIPKDSMNIDRMVADLMELVHHLRSRFNQNKIFLIGHSWGTILSLLAVQRYPDFFHGYIAVSQVVNMKENERVSYEYTFRRAKEAGNEKAYAQLVKIGPPPWNSLRGDRIHSKYLQEFGGGMMHKGGLMKPLFKPLISNGEYNLYDMIKWVRGQMFSIGALKEELASIDFFQTVWEIKVPVLFCCGRYDYTAPSKIAVSYFKELTAPYKRLIWFEHSAHSAPFEENKLFIKSVNDFVDDVQFTK